MVSFAVQKILSLIKSHLFIFAFISFDLGNRSRKMLLQFMSKRVLLMFSSRSFMVSGLTFRSLILSEFFFFNIYLFIWLLPLLVVACGIYFPDQGSNPGPLHWECGVSTTGLQGKSLSLFLYMV